jgi:L-seryl-tRNA(Ser) seleniumtransferase
MAQSGARLVEVGTTNRTHVSDYEQAIGEDTAAIMVAHHSNFKIVGFTKEPQLKELAALALEHNLLLLFDQGSGAVVETTTYGLDHEPTVNEALEQGVDIVSFSGDKLLGGPQAGIICGRSALIEILRSHPLARAMRADKFTLAALSATLYTHLKGRREEDLPVWQMIAVSIDQIVTRASAICDRLVEAGIAAEVIDGKSTIGGGSLPGATLPTKLVAVRHPNLDGFARFLRLNDPVIIARIAGDRLLCDPRTLMAGQDKDLIEAIIKASNEVKKS